MDHLKKKSEMDHFALLTPH